MMKIKHVVLFFIVTLQIGCVVFPVTRTYFEPNIEDGRPTRSSSCGYNRTADDSLERDSDGLHIQVSPSYQPGSPVSVTILFQGSVGDMDLQPEQFELHSVSDGSIYKPSDISRNVYRPDKSHPYHSIWIHITYPVVSEKLQGIKFVFPNGSIMRNGVSINMNPFRFNKVTKSYLYYGSINC